MPDVPLYVAAITAAAGVAGAAIPAIAVIIRDVRQAERDRRERRAEAKRQACLDLLRAAGELRTRVANAAEYHGAEMSGLLAGIRECEAAVRLNAVSVALLAPGKLADSAEKVADAASRLAMFVADNTDKHAGEMLVKPNFAKLDESVEDFSRTAVAEAAK
jgi:hypothetical protein